MRLDVDSVGDIPCEVLVTDHSVVHLVGLHNEAVIVSIELRVVACFRIDADWLEARSIVISSKGVIVCCSGICASGDFKAVADSVTIGIDEAVSVAVVSFIGEGARSIIVGCFFVVIARCCVGTSSDFELVTDSVLIRIVQAYAITVISVIGVCT